MDSCWMVDHCGMFADTFHDAQVVRIFCNIFASVWTLILYFP